MRAVDESRQQALAALTREAPSLGRPAEPQPPAPTDFEHWRWHLDVDGVAWAVLDKKGSSANTLAEPVLNELNRLLGVLEPLRPMGLAIRSAKPSGFIAGAEIGEFRTMTVEPEIRERIRQGLEVLDRLEKFPAPTVAVIHGFCLGGGLELALACRYRIARADARLGFPEVLLGLHPGLAGTWRTLRLTDPIEGVTLMLTGRTLKAEKARRAGLVDAVTEERHLAAAVRFAVLGKIEAKRGTSLRARLLDLPPVRQFIAQRMERQTAKKVRREHYPAPYALIDLWRQHGRDEAALRLAETDSFARLMTGESARNLVRVFFLRERLKGLAKGIAHGIRRVHVIGAGVMGGDIAAGCALRGFHVTLQDRELKYVAPVIRRAAELFGQRLDREGDVRAALDRIAPDLEGGGLARADLVIEAVPENPETKRKVFAAAEARMGTGAILATNTSSILLENLRGSLRHPERFLGLHFFNPVAQMPLVEVVTHDGLDDSARDRAVAFVAALDKLPLPVKSAPGFLVNRALTPYLMEAFVAYGEGIKPELIDAAAESFGMPMGPLELADTVGLDVALHVAEMMKRDLPQPLPEIPGWFADLVKQGKLGKKSGHGIYPWKDGKPHKSRVDTAPDAAMQDRLVLPLLNACVSCLREGIATDEDAIDAGIVFGTGFAPFRGGPLHYARSRGVDDIVRRLKSLVALHGTRFALPDPGWSALKE